MLKCMKDMGLLDRGYIFLEIGAGKGYLASALAE